MASMAWIGGGMNISRNFLVIGVVYLLIGMGLGAYMGGSGNHTLTPVHAHINLLGFTLMSIFAVVYKVFPALAESALSRLHFWLQQIGTLVMLVSLYLLISGFVAAGSIGPVLGVTEIVVILAVATFGLNVLQNAK